MQHFQTCRSYSFLRTGVYWFAQQIPLRCTAEPREVALAYLVLMRCGFITGQTIAIDVGLPLVT